MPAPLGHWLELLLELLEARAPFVLVQVLEAQVQAPEEVLVVRRQGQQPVVVVVQSLEPSPLQP